MWIPLWPHDDDHDDDDSNFLVSFFFIAGRIFATCESEFLCGFSDLCSILFFFHLFPCVKVIARFFHSLVLFPRVFPLAIPLLFFSYFSSLSYFICCCFRYFLRYQWSQYGSRTLRRKILCYCNTWLSCNILLSIITLDISLLNFILLKFLILNIFRLTKLMSLLHTKIKISERKRRSLCKVK